jgi:hypothetical protein
MSDFIVGIVSFLFTIMILSYLIGDNFLFRLAVHIFVGVSAGYVAAVAIHQVILPYLIMPLIQGSAEERTLLAIPLIFFVLMLMKISPRLSSLGGPAVGYLVGAGAAVAISGAVLGTILPQAAAAVQPFDWAQNPNPLGTLFNGAIMLIGTIATLVYFQFGARRADDGSVKRSAIVETLAWVGKLFVALTLGVLFAGVLSAALTALIERIHSMLALFGF